MTHSVQTELSHYRRDVDTQVYLPKYEMSYSSELSCLMCTLSYRQAETQTKRVKHTSVPQPSRFIAGLRGDGGANRATTVDLTLSIRTHNIAEDYEPKKH